MYIFTNSDTPIFIHKTELVYSFLCNVTVYFELVDARISVSEKDLPVPVTLHWTE